MLEKIVKMLGASPTQYRYLLNTEKLVEKRALKGNRFVNLSLALNCAIFFFMGLSTASMLLLPLDVFTYALISITMSMAMIGIWTIPYFDMLLSPIHYPIVAHTPVSSRTYFLVKLTQVLTHNRAVVSQFQSAPGYRWYLDSCPRVFSVPIPLSACIPTDRLLVRLFHDWCDDSLRRVFDKALYQKESPKYRTIRAVYISRSFPHDMDTSPSVTSRIIRWRNRKINTCSEMVLRAPKRLVCGGSIAHTWGNRTAFPDFSRTRCCLNTLFGVCPASEYRKELFRISLVLVGIRHSSEIRVKGENAAVRENDPKSCHPCRVLPRHRIFVSREAHIATTLRFVRWHPYNRSCIYSG